MSLEKENNEFLKSAHQAAVKEFDAFLVGQLKGSSTSPKALKRQAVVDAEVELYGSDSIFKACEKYFVAGNGVVVKTLNQLQHKGVRTKSDLLAFDTDRKQRRNTGFGSKSVITVDLMKNMFALEKGIQ